MLTLIATRAWGIRATYLGALFGILTVALAADAPAQLFTFSQTQGNNDANSNDRANRYDPFNNATPLGVNAQATGANAANTQVSTGPNQSFSEVDLQGHETAQNASNSAAAEAGEGSILRPLPKPSEFETYVSTVVDKPLRRFGAELLIPNARNFTPPPTTAVPPDYRLNPGDQLILGFTGSTVADGLRLTIDADGRIFVPRVGAIELAGVRFDDARAVIAQQMSRFYRNFDVSVAVGQLHGITVYVTGFAATPGSYTVSSLSTLVNAVLAAGGPSAGGSFRSIQLRRNGQLVSDFDLYDLLLRGDKSADQILQDGDVIYIAPIGAQAAVIGSVNREAIYEAKPNDNLRDVLLYAGGVSTVADDSRMLLLDSVGAPSAGWQELSLQQAATMSVRRGEVLRVLSNLNIAQPIGKLPVLVTLTGEVARPGRYYVQPGSSLVQVIEQAGGITRDAYMYGVVFTRDRVRQEQRVSNQRALDDMEQTLTAQPLVSLTARDVPDRLTTVRNLMQEMRAAQPDGRLILDTPSNATTVGNDMILENNDNIYIPPRPANVGVFGSVPSPSSFVYRTGETIGDVLKRAGGVKRFADRNQIFVVRANGSVLSRNRRGSIGHVLKQKALPGDLIYVPINALRGEFWANLRDATSGLTGPLTAAATITALTN